MSEDDEKPHTHENCTHIMGPANETPVLIIEDARRDPLNLALLMATMSAGEHHALAALSGEAPPFPTMPELAEAYRPPPQRSPYDRGTGRWRPPESMRAMMERLGAAPNDDKTT